MSAQDENSLTPRQHKAILALLSADTHEAAAAEAAVSSGTLRRWLKEDAFLSCYRDARRSALDGAIARLQATACEAANTLAANLEAESEGIQVRAATAILDRAIRGQELFDLLQRVEALESAQEPQRKGAREGVHKWGT